MYSGLLDSLCNDLRFAFRLLVRHPGFSLVACFTLAIGIGANTAVFTVINAVVLQPLPFREPAKLVYGEPIWRAGGSQRTGFVPAADFIEYRERATTTFEQLAAISGAGSEITGMFSLTGEEGAEYVAGGEVSYNFFDALGVAPQAGHTFRPDDENWDPGRVVIISHGLWQRRFHGAPAIGKAMMVDGSPMEVVGIMPEGFSFPDHAGLWVPLALGKVTRARAPRAVQPLGRLKASMAAAQGELDAISQSLAHQYPVTNAGKLLRLIQMDDALRGGARKGLFLLLGGAAFVLLIAISNVANLQLVRASARTREIVLRTALGASSWRLVRQLMAENIILSLLGAAGGGLLAHWTLPLVLSLMPAGSTEAAKVHLDLTVLAFTAAIAVLAGVLFGLAPARDLLRRDLALALRQSGRGIGQGRTRMREALVAIQVGLAFVLVTGCGLLLVSLLRLRRVDPGFNPHRVVSVLLMLAPARYPTRASVVNFQQQLLDKVRGLPGVTGAAVVKELPIRGVNFTSFVVRGDRRGIDEPAMAEIVWLSPEALPAFQIPLLRGRMFTAEEGMDTPSTVIINEALARRFFPGQDPIGQRLVVTGTFAPGKAGQEIIGVVGNAQHVSLSTPAAAAVYLPSLALRWGYLFVRTQGDPLRLTAAISAELKRLDPDHPIGDFKTLDGVIEESLVQPRFRATLLTVFGVFALLLAAIGLYGVLSYAVAQRNHELAVRIAVGAQRSDLMRVVVLHGGLLALIGIAAGFPVAVGLARALSAFLFEVSPADPLLFAASVAGLLVVAVAATLVPALKAAKADPIAALRQE